MKLVRTKGEGIGPVQSSSRLGWSLSLGLGLASGPERRRGEERRVEGRGGFETKEKVSWDGLEKRREERGREDERFEKVDRVWISIVSHASHASLHLDMLEQQMPVYALKISLLISSHASPSRALFLWLGFCLVSAWVLLGACLGTGHSCGNDWMTPATSGLSDKPP